MDAPQTSLDTDREALVAFYNATDGPNWRANCNWLSDAPMEDWVGVTTDIAGRVIGLEFTASRVSGEIPPEIGNLSRLKWLTLVKNDLRGEIPPELGKLTRLERISLGLNRLSGEIP